MEPIDRDYIVQTWLRANLSRSAIAKSIPRGVYFKNHNRLINYHLDFCQTKVACDEEGFILGFISYENIQEPSECFDLLHFIFVRKEMRNQKIGTNLINCMKNAKDLFYTHQGDIYNLWGKYEKKVFNPYLFWGAR